MSDQVNAAGAPKRKPFKKQIYRGIEIDKLLEMNTENIVALFKSGQRRRFKHGIHPKYDRLIKKLKTSVKNTPHGEKPKAVKTHLRNAIIMPEMVGSVVAIYNGKAFQNVEIKGEMIGHYLAEFALSYRPVFHGRPGVGSAAARFIPLS